MASSSLNSVSGTIFPAFSGASATVNDAAGASGANGRVVIKFS